MKTKSAIGKTYVRARVVPQSEMFMRQMVEQVVLWVEKRKKGKKTIQVDGEDVKAPYKVLSLPVAKMIKKTLEANRDSYGVLTPAKAQENYFKNVSAKCRELTLRLSLRENPIWAASVCKGHFEKPDPDTPSNAAIAEDGDPISDKEMLRSKTRSGRPAYGVMIMIPGGVWRYPPYLFLVRDDWERGKAAEEAGARRMIGNGFDQLVRPGTVRKVAFDHGMGHNGGPLLEEAAVHSVLMRLRELAETVSDDPVIAQWVTKILTDEMNEGKLAATAVPKRERELLDIIFPSRRQERLDARIARHRATAKGGDPSSPTQPPLSANAQPPKKLDE